MNTPMTTEQRAMIEAAARAAAKEVSRELPTKEEIRQISRDAAEEAVNNIFAKFGLDPNNPKETMELLVWAREAKETAGTVKRQAVVSAIGILISGALFAIWASIRGIR